MKREINPKDGKSHYGKEGVRYVREGIRRKGEANSCIHLKQQQQKIVR